MAENLNEPISRCDKFNFFEPVNRPPVPTIFEWEQLWISWNIVTNMINRETMLFEQPIALRNPFIFYMGHIPTFLDVMLSRHKVDSETNEYHGPSDSVKFADIFERGIDPDMDNPKKCNPHSIVPDDESDWPSVESILQYQERVRNRLRRLLLSWTTDYTTSLCNNTTRQQAGRVVWMCFEHEAMHLETLLYMLVQSPNIKVPSVQPPLWYGNDGHHNKMKFPALDTPNMLDFNGETVEMGLDLQEFHFGWDNEYPKRLVPVSSFQLQSRPVTNGEYWTFWKDSGRHKTLFPAAWHYQDIDELPKVKTCFGLCEFSFAVDWPAQVSCQQAEAYAAKFNMRLPTESEWIHFRRTMETSIESLQTTQNRRQNYGFNSWTPQPLNNEGVHVLGDVWEWTSTIFNFYEGFISSPLYPGYSSDFFDGKHRVVLGASWATHPRIAERKSFRNWYQWRYPYVFCGFRLCRSL